jgi:hypothetical protein
LGKWDVKDVPLKQDASRWSILSLAAYFGVRGTLDVDDKKDSIDLTDIAVEKRSEDEEITEAQLSSWGANDTLANRKDVGHLLKIWNGKRRFYWIPLGSEFPGLDSVYRDDSKAYFVQVKTGKTAIDAARWIEKAFVYSKLLLEALGNPTDIKVALLVGSEPSQCPVLENASETI